MDYDSMNQDMMFGIDMEDQLSSSSVLWSPSLPSAPIPIPGAQASPKHSYHPMFPEYQLALSETEDNHAYYSRWLTDSALEPLSAPIPIPDIKPHAASNYHSYSDTNSPFLHDVASFSPGSSFSPDSDFIALHSPAPSPTMSFPAEIPFGSSMGSMSPHESGMHFPPPWATQLWNDRQHPSPSPPRAFPPQTLFLSENEEYSYERPRFAGRRYTESSAPSLLFQPSSAPSALTIRAPSHRPQTRTRRSESVSVAPVSLGLRELDRDATIRRPKKRSPPRDITPAPISPSPKPTSDKSVDPPMHKSLLRPPKLAPSAWQLYFTDWIQRHQATSNKKLNVAQAAKEAGQEYAGLSVEEKEPYKRRSQLAKDAREREHAAYMRSLSPEDIKRENLFRTAQRKAGKSRRGNIKDPNAPKKPLSAYFMFLQRIRSDPELVEEVFGEETETTKQSVLAATKWRSMTDDERKPFLAQAEQEKLDYEAKRKLYEEGTTGYGGSFNFSILPGQPIDIALIPRSLKSSSSVVVKIEPSLSENESDGGFTTDDSATMGTIRWR